MKFLKSKLGLFVLMLGAAFVQAADLIPSIPVKNEAFELGERLEFNIAYEFMKAGEASLEITAGPDVNGKGTWFIVSQAKSVGMVDGFYRVRDFNQSTVEVDTLASLGLHQNVREGNFKILRNTTINYSSGTWNYERQYKGKTSNRTGVVTQRVRDILSAFYAARVLNLEVGKTYHVDVFAEEKFYPIRVVVGPKLKKIKVPAGEFECLEVQPFMETDGIFNAKDGKLTIYMTNDQRKIPVLMQSKVFIGSVDAELVKYRYNAQDPFRGK